MYSKKRGSDSHLMQKNITDSSGNIVNKKLQQKFSFVHNKASLTNSEPMKRETSVSRFKVSQVGSPPTSLQLEAEKLNGNHIPAPLFKTSFDEPDLVVNNHNDNDIPSNNSEEGEAAINLISCSANPQKQSVKQVQFSVGANCFGADSTDQEENNIASNENTQHASHDAATMSFRNMQTVEKVPHIDHYRNMQSVAKAISCRPTLSELHEPEEQVTMLDEDEKLQSFIPPVQTSSMVSKLGWIKGVLIRCILCILGVMLYLRLSWVAAQAGIGLGCLIVLLGSIVTTLTTLSLCAISTNGEVKGGGAYFLLSRSLGPEFGGSIGVIFSFANAVAAAMYIVGFSESVRDLMKEYSKHIFDNTTNDVRVIGLCTAVILLGVVMIGVQFETKAQMVLLFVLALSILSFIMGTVFPVSKEKAAKGITGYSWTTFSDNFGPHWRGETFFSVFAIYFPAATGIMAGANISGDLADPQKSIPKGTLWAILITTIIYISSVTITGSTCARDASGNLTDYIVNGTLQFFPSLSCIAEENCPFGLHNYFRVMELESIWSPLVTGGVFAATLSSALASLVSAPKVFQALCKDKLFPYITYFGIGYGKSDEPRTGYILSFVIACSLIAIGDLNAIAPIISNFFLASYALINYACFDATFANSPGFRPAFKYYNQWLSLFGAVVCVAVMFLISWWTALVTYAIILALYVYLLRRKPDVNWGSSSQAHAYRNALNAVIRLNNIEEHVKNYRPQILILTGHPVDRSLLIDFASNISKENSLLLCGHVIMGEDKEKIFNNLPRNISTMNAWLRHRKTRGFYIPTTSDSLETGVLNLLQISGLGKLKPNILFMGYKKDWRVCTQAEVNQYVNMIHYAFDHMMGVAILRLQHGTEIKRQISMVDSKSQLFVETEITVPLTRYPSFLALPGSSSSANLSTLPSYAQLSSINGQASKASTVFLPSMAEVKNFPPRTASAASGNALHTVTIKVDENSTTSQEKDESSKTPYAIVIDEIGEKEEDQNITDTISYVAQFQHRVKKAIIDVYWLFDDGGLTLLIPHLLTQSKSYLEGAKLRVFTIASSRHHLEQEQRSMAALLSKFRIDYSDVFVIPDITGKPRPESKEEFMDLIRPFLEENNSPSDECRENSGTTGHMMINNTEISIQKERTNRQLRIRELLLKHSIDSTLIVLTMPIPRRNVFSSVLFMAWLETLTKGLPPVLLIRGNQQSVLTFYT